CVRTQREPAQRVVHVVYRAVECAKRVELRLRTLQVLESRTAVAKMKFKEALVKINIVKGNRVVFFLKHGHHRGFVKVLARQQSRIRGASREVMNHLEHRRDGSGG